MRVTTVPMEACLRCPASVDHDAPTIVSPIGSLVVVNHGSEASTVMQKVQQLLPAPPQSSFRHHPYSWTRSRINTTTNNGISSSSAASSHVAQRPLPCDVCCADLFDGDACTSAHLLPFGASDDMTVQRQLSMAASSSCAATDDASLLLSATHSTASSCNSPSLTVGPHQLPIHHSFHQQPAQEAAAAAAASQPPQQLPPFMMLDTTPCSMMSLPHVTNVVDGTPDQQNRSAANHVAQRNSKKQPQQRTSSSSSMSQHSNQSPSAPRFALVQLKFRCVYFLAPFRVVPGDVVVVEEVDLTTLCGAAPREQGGDVWCGVVRDVSLTRPASLPDAIPMQSLPRLVRLARSFDRNRKSHSMQEESNMIRHLRQVVARSSSLGDSLMCRILTSIVDSEFSFPPSFSCNDVAEAASTLPQQPTAATAVALHVRAAVAGLMENAQLHAALVSLGCLMATQPIIVVKS